MPENNHKDRDLAAFVQRTEAGERLDKRLHNIYAKELFISGEDKDFIAARDFFRQSCLDDERSVDEIKEAGLRGGESG